MLARQRKKQIAAAKPLLKIFAATRARPVSKVWTGESASRRPSRAAMAPPSIPTINVRCWTMALEPEMSVLNTWRKRISATGSSSMAASATTSRRFSPWQARRSAPERIARSGVPTRPETGGAPLLISVLLRRRRDALSTTVALHQTCPPARSGPESDPAPYQ